MTTPADPFDLQRFVAAQAVNLDDALAELQAGAKRTHWMWYVFPQLAGLGRSKAARRYAIGSRAEALAYLAHPLLGPRLAQCTALAFGQINRSARGIFGTPDDLKFRSSMTLFAAVAGPDSIYARTLDKYFDGPDPHSQRLLAAVSGAGGDGDAINDS